MIVVPVGVKMQLALGHTDMRKGLDGLATLRPLIARIAAYLDFTAYEIQDSSRCYQRKRISAMNTTGSVYLRQPACEEHCNCVVRELFKWLASLCGKANRKTIELVKLLPCFRKSPHA